MSFLLCTCVRVEKKNSVSGGKRRFLLETADKDSSSWRKAAVCAVVNPAGLCRKDPVGSRELVTCGTSAPLKKMCFHFFFSF